MFELVPIINSMKDKTIAMDAISAATFTLLYSKMKAFLEEVFGLQSVSENDYAKLKDVMQLVLDIRKEAKENKNFVLSDKIRNQLAAAGILVKDEKGGNMSWTID